MGEVGPEKDRLSWTQPPFSEPVLLPCPSRSSQIFPLALSYREGSVERESSVPLTLSSLSFWSLGFLCTPPFDLSWGPAFFVSRSLSFML